MWDLTTWTSDPNSPFLLQRCLWCQTIDPVFKTSNLEVQLIAFLPSAPKMKGNCQDLCAF